MTLSVSIDASDVDGITPGTVDPATMASGGEAAFGGFDVEDPAAALTITGHRPVWIEESACSQPRLFTGWTTERTMGRDRERALIVEGARLHDVTIVDLNALFGFRQIHGSDGNRPSETWNARLAWLIGSSYLSGLIADTGYTRSITSVMDAADYRGSTPSAVLDDLADRQASPLNYFAFYDPVAIEVGLFFDYYDAAVNDSTLRISNVIADSDAVTFYPDAMSRLSREPDQTYSEVVVEYDRGSKRYFRSRASTATNYIQRGTTIQRPYTRSLATAKAQAAAFLDQHASELDRYTVTITVPPASAGLVTAGQRMNVKLSHLPGYTAWTTMRVVSATATPTDDTVQQYAIALQLVSPRPAVEPGEDTEEEMSPTPGVTVIATGGGGEAIDTFDDRTQVDWGTASSGYEWTIIGSNLAAGVAAGLGDAAFGGDTPSFEAVVAYPLPTVAEVLWRWAVPADSDTLSTLFIMGGLTAIRGAPSDTTWYFSRCQTTATERRIRTWVDGDAEPGTWDETIAGSFAEVRLYVMADTDFGHIQIDYINLTNSGTVTPTTDGSETTFTLATGYRAGSLLVFVAGIPIMPSAITETDPAAGSFTLAVAPASGNTLLVSYIVG